MSECAVDAELEEAEMGCVGLDAVDVERFNRVCKSCFMHGPNVWSAQVNDSAADQTLLEHVCPFHWGDMWLVDSPD
jgi:hypothetical protein